MVAVATSLAHDGLASPVSVLSAGDTRGSFGVATPIAVAVDLAFVRRSPARFLRAGIGDLVSNLSAIADWRLGNAVNGEPIDGLALALASAAAESIVDRRDDMRGAVPRDAGAVADPVGHRDGGRRHARPCSGACHEISHAVDQLFVDRATHGEQVALGALFRSCSATTTRWSSASVRACVTTASPPRRPRSVSPTTSSSRRSWPRPTPVLTGSTILEHLGLDEAAIARQVRRLSEDLRPGEDLAEPSARVALVVVPHEPPQRAPPIGAVGDGRQRQRLVQR